MLKVSYGLILAVLTTVLPLGQAVAEERPSPQALVGTADRYRLPFAGANLKVHLTSYRGGEEFARANYHVWANGNLQSLVAMLDPKVMGQKVLMTQEGLWLHMPSSRRAIRITPMQRLMGQASYGDITQLKMNGLYEAEYNPSAPETSFKGVAVWNLLLQAKKLNATYYKISLLVAKDDGRPIKAELYLQSGKLLKTAIYGPVENTTYGPAITKTIFLDAIHANRETLMVLGEVEKKDFTGTDFSIRALARWNP